MENSFSIKVNENLDFQLSKDDIEKLDILKTSKKDFHLLYGSKSFHIEVVSTDFNNRSYVLRVNGMEYHTSIENKLDKLIDAMGFASNGTKNITSIEAPMPGLILDISVKAGQEVAEDDQLLILEAMKMENIISSPRAGVIKEISVKKGEAVDKKQILLTFE
ncbi:acetyl-CoA carboxylase biotin carboxyl carrier protein subunit [Flagellimonas allohymeniacidonis]|uniref:Acetyl-CoA carboxylase biotin carboxyl carrier protein subunit n=1 Tax=Flagellimonas allohymeniacidonis TaxID=2517819 RepID=A0A4Q8QLX7_9FLAO|nr:acetyl-CoA carboxylase biotin carboxyl carrier protein subunit [Allomuricauda hymeniacidonis]TAI49296.1 acetyl-CoA carboxylase biotin carboxyl carrier protein subunit [Allomuricauda hymeniacidonis]